MSGAGGLGSKGRSSKLVTTIAAKRLPSKAKLGHGLSVFYKGEEEIYFEEPDRG